jgi:hypothetical protein
LTLANSHATRLGGGRLSIDRPITATGFAALAFDIGHSILGIRYCDMYIEQLYGILSFTPFDSAL